jgi:hypothetical protein
MSDLAVIGDAILSPIRKRFPRTHRFPRLHRKHIVINIRGTNGSGKTTLARTLLEKFKGVPLEIQRIGGDKLIVGYWLNTPGVPTFLVGPYRITTGGCDAIGPVAEAESIKPFDYICKLIRNSSKAGNIVFEGAIVATVTQRWVDLAKDLPNTRWIFGFMDTPLEKCLKRVAKRREIRGDPRPLDPNKSVIPKHKAVLGSEKRLKEVGMDVRQINHRDALNTVLRWLGETDGH